MQCIVNFFPGGIDGKTESYGAVPQLSGQFHGFQRGGRLRLIGGAGTSGGDIDPLLFQCVQHHLAADSGKGYTDHMGCRGPASLRRNPVDAYTFHLADLFRKIFLQLIQPPRILIQMGVYQLCRLGHTRDTGHVLRAGTHIFLLAAAVYDGLELYPLPHIEESHALGAVDLMAAGRQQIDLHPPGQYPEFAKPLHRVHMEKDRGVSALDQRSRLLDRLQRSHLIVGVHDRYQNRFGPYGRLQILQGYPPPGIHRQISDLKSLTLQILHGLQHRRMFHLSGYQVIALSAGGHGAADQGHIVCFRAS